MNRQQLASLVDHTNLKPEATQRDIEALCSDCKEHGFYAVCVNPVWVELCKAQLARSNVKVATVVGFPLGANTTQIKVEEAQRAVGDGADELDMVMQIGMLKAGNDFKARRDVEAVVRVAFGRPVKVIIECALLTDEEKVRACRLAEEAGAAFVKTSTGFNPAGGAKVEDVRLMRKTVGERLGVKAAGGIRTLQEAVAMVEAGANRIGMSASVSVMKELAE